MKTALKIVVAVAVVNAALRGGDSAWRYYQLKDAAQRALLFGSSSTSQQLHTQIMESAMELGIPLEPQGLRVHWKTGRRSAEASYTQQIEFIPSYQYPVRFSFNIDTDTVGTPPANDDYPPEPR